MRDEKGGCGRQKTAFGGGGGDKNVTGGTMKVDLSRSSPLHPYAKFAAHTTTVTYPVHNMYDHCCSFHYYCGAKSSRIACEGKTKSPSPPHRYISPNPDKQHIPHRTPLCKRTHYTDRSVRLQRGEECLLRLLLKGILRRKSPSESSRCLFFVCILPNNYFISFDCVVSLSSFCIFLSLCVALSFVVLALVVLPGWLYSAAYRAAFLA